MKQRLALGNLLPKIRDAYRCDEISRQTIRLLTMTPFPSLAHLRSLYDLVVVSPVFLDE